MRFAFTGIFNTIVHIISATMVIEFIMPKPPLANAIAFVVATLNSYYINTIWSFSGKLQQKTLLRFFVVSVIGFLIALIVSWSADKIGLHYLYGISLVILTVMPITFLLHNLWTYK